MDGKSFHSSDAFSQEISEKVSEPTTITNLDDIEPSTTEIYIKSTSEKEISETNVYYYDDEEDEEDYLGIIEEPIDRISEDKHVIIFVKTQQENSFLTSSELQYGLKRVVDYNMTIFINDEPAVVQQTINAYGNVIFVDANIDNNRKISGNVFTNSKPLEQLEGEDYEEALSILNQVSSILEGSVASYSNTTTTQSAIIVSVPRKIIIMITSPVSIMKEDVETVLKNELSDGATEVVVHVNAPQEVLQQEYQTQAVPILVTPVVDRDLKSVSGNIYYNSEPLENIRDLEKYDETYKILSTVNSLIEANAKRRKNYEENLSYGEISQNKIKESKKVLIAIHLEESLIDRINSDHIMHEVSNQENIETVVLFNPSKELIHQQFDGYTVPILINLVVKASLELEANILYKYQPIENLDADLYDEAVRFLSMAKSIVQRDLEIIAQQRIEEESALTYDTYEERANIIGSEFILSDYEVDEQEGSGSEETYATDNPSKNLDFGFIQEIVSL